MTRLIAQAAAAFALSIALHASAGAQDQAPPPEVMRTARSAFDAGVVAAKSEDYALARTLFLRSRTLAEKPTTLLNLALVDAKLGLADEGLEALDTLARISSGKDYERIRQRAESLRTELEGLRATQASAVSQFVPESLAPPSPPPEPTPEEAPPQAVVAPVTAPQPEPSVSRDARGGHPAHLMGPRALIVTGAVLAAGGVGAAIWWANRGSSLEECETLSCPEKSRIETEKGAALAVTLGLGAGAVALVTGGSVWLVKRKREHDAHGISHLQMRWLGQGVAVAGRF